MAERVIATVSIEARKDGKFFYSLDEGETEVGPFDTEELATEAATAFLQSSFAAFAKQAIMGDPK